MKGISLIHPYIQIYGVAAHELNQIITERGLTNSVQKTKSMAFKRRAPVRTKIVKKKKKIKKKQLRGLSPRANYTDRAAAAGRRS